MNTNDVIRQSGFDSERTALVEQVFEQCWAELETQLPNKDSEQRAQLRLVNVICLLARVVTDEDRLKSASLRAFNGAGRE